MSNGILSDYRKVTLHREINQMSHPNLSQIEQECQECLIQGGKIHIQQNLNEGLKYL